MNYFIIIAYILSYAGYYLINKRKILGYILWIMQNVTWIIYCIFAKDHAQILLWASYIFFNIHGILIIRKERMINKRYFKVYGIEE
jgi:hypothetical protein